MPDLIKGFGDIPAYNVAVVSPFLVYCYDFVYPSQCNIGATSSSKSILLLLKS